jgi:hypothetical protein
LESGAIDVGVTCANHRIAEAARADVAHRARLSELLQALRIATVTVVQVVVVAAFARIDDTIAAAGGHACVRVEDSVALLARGTISIVVANALIDHRIAKTARAGRRSRAALEKLDETHGIAAIGGRRIAVIATFTHFDDAIAAPRSDAHIRVRYGIANIRHRAIRRGITRANVTVGIAESAGANHVGETGLSKLFQANPIAAVIGHGIAIVAAFSRIEDAIAATGRDADVRVRRDIASLPSRTIGIFIASANVSCGIAKAAGARRTQGTHLTEFLETNGIATVAVGQVAIVATFGCANLPITAKGTPERPARNGIREFGIEATANGTTRAISTEVPTVVG